MRSIAESRRVVVTRRLITLAERGTPRAFTHAELLAEVERDISTIEDEGSVDEARRAMEEMRAGITA
jgi:hypothetical protein